MCTAAEHRQRANTVFSAAGLLLLVFCCWFLFPFYCCSRPYSITIVQGFATPCGARRGTQGRAVSSILATGRPGGGAPAMRIPGRRSQRPPLDRAQSKGLPTYLHRARAARATQARVSRGLVAAVGWVATHWRNCFSYSCEKSEGSHNGENSRLPASSAFLLLLFVFSFCPISVRLSQRLAALSGGARAAVRIIYTPFFFFFFFSWPFSIRYSVASTLDPGPLMPQRRLIP